MAKVTIATISEVTGLSRGTVSRALNNKPDISEATRQRVLAACREHNYVPSERARTLATGRNLAVAAVVESLADEFAVQVLRGAAARGAESRYAIHIAELGTNADERRQRLANVLTDRIDAALWIGVPRPDERATLQERLESHPLAVTNNDDTLMGADRFAPDEVEAGRLLARHLLTDAGGSVVFVQTPGAPAPRRTGFLEAARQMGREPRVVTMPQAGAEGRAGWTDLAAQIAEADVIAADQDDTAMIAALCAAEQGRMAGRHYRLGGIGNSRQGALLPTPLTTVDLNGFEVGQRALDMLLQRIENQRQDAPAQTLVAPRLIVRTSAP